MKRLGLCSLCDEKAYCKELCLEAVASEHETPAERQKGKYVNKPTALTNYADSRILAKSHPWMKAYNG